jgi:hypothetical protein
MANFVDFIAGMAKDKALAQEVVNKIKTASAADLNTRFKGKGFDVSVTECQKLVSSQTQLWEIGDSALRNNY